MQLVPVFAGADLGGDQHLGAVVMGVPLVGLEALNFRPESDPNLLDLS